MANDFNARCGVCVGWLPPRSALKSFNAQLAMHYPAYTTVIYTKLKLLMTFRSNILKMTVIFVS